MKNNKLVILALFLSLAIALSALERLIPLQAFIPIIGIKLGLTNIATLIMLYLFDKKMTLLVIGLRCFSISLLFGGITSFIFSFSGGIFAFIAMLLIYKFRGFFSIIGVSIAGAAAHSIGQICAAYLVLSSIYVFAYLPYLLFCSIFTGGVIGGISLVVLPRIKISLKSNPH